MRKYIHGMLSFVFLTMSACSGGSEVESSDTSETTEETGTTTVDDTGTVTDIDEELLECVVQIGGCDLILEADDENYIIVQGPGYWADDGLDHAGETLCIPSGDYRALSFHGLRGREDSPILITNCGEGRVVVDPQGTSSALGAHGSRYLHISGTGDPEQEYGFLLKNAGSGRSIVDMQGGVSDIELDHLEVEGPAYSGIAIRSYPYCDESLSRSVFTQHNTLIHHNYVHDVSGEGLYIGPSHYFEDYSPTSGEECSPGFPEAALIGVQVHDNIVEDVGRDGIQVGAAIEGMSINNNTIRRYALSGDFGHNGGIQINPGSVGWVYGNLIESVSGGGSDNAIQFAGGVDGPTYIYNNMVLGSATPFIALSRMGSADSDVFFLNNTVVNQGNSGHTMTLFCSEEWVQNFYFKNNIFSNYENVGYYIYTGSDGEIWTGLVGGGSAINCPINGLVHGNDLDENHQIEGNLYLRNPLEVGFVDAIGGDYHLDQGSPAIATGENLSEIFTDDFEGNERTDGAFDMGALRY